MGRLSSVNVSVGFRPHCCRDARVWLHALGNSVAFLLFSWLTAKTSGAVNTFTAPWVLLQTLGTSFIGLPLASTLP